MWLLKYFKYMNSSHDSSVGQRLDFSLSWIKLGYYLFLTDL